MTEVYIARVDALCDDAVFAARYAQAPAERRAKIDALRHAADKRLSLGVWLLLAAALRKRGITAPHLAYDENGKPYLADCPSLHVSLSHSGEAVMCAVSDGEVGCDIERLGDADISLAARWFHPAEQARLFSAPTEERRALFYRIWTAKESFAKCTGGGIAHGMRDFFLEPAGTVHCGEKQYHIKYVDFDGYAACVCTEAQEDIDATRDLVLY